MESPLKFTLFGVPHLVTLLLFLLLGLGLISFAKGLSREKQERIGLLMGILVCMFTLLWPAYYLAEGTFSAANDLPLDMCYIAGLTAPFLMQDKYPALYQVLYFWVMTATLQACITPNVAHEFPHIWYIRFFVNHCGLVVLIMYSTFVYGNRPTLKGLWLSYGSLFVFACCIFLVNIMLGSNYMFTNAKPDNPSALDFLGPYPWYMVSTAVISLAMFFLVYLPFRNHKTKSTI